MKKYITTTILLSSFFILSDSLQAVLECPPILPSDARFKKAGNDYTITIRKDTPSEKGELHWWGRSQFSQSPAPLLKEFTRIDKNANPDFTCSYTIEEATGTGFPLTLRLTNVKFVDSAFEFNLEEAKILIADYLKDPKLPIERDNKNWTVSISDKENLVQNLKSISKPNEARVVRAPSGEILLEVSYVLGFGSSKASIMELTTPITINDF